MSMKTLATLAPIALLFAACGGNTINTSGTGTTGGSSTGGSSGVPAVTASVGANGGTVATTDGSGVTIPAAALSASVSISVTPTPKPANLPSFAQIVGAPYVLGPAGQTFTSAVTVTIAEPAGTASGAVIQFQPANAQNPTTFVPLQTTQVDATHVSVQTKQLGTFVATIPNANCGVVIDYPGNACSWGVNVGNTFPDSTLSGGAVLNFSKTAVVDSTSGSSLAPSFSFAQLQQLSAQGFRYAFLDISAVWCPHCNDEANTLPGSYVATWLAQGGIIFSVLVQGGNTNALGVYPAATVSDLNTWITGHGGGVNYPMSLDGNQDMVTATGLQAWPANLIIRLSDMTVVDSVFGATNAFYQEFESVLVSCQATADCWSGATCTSGQCH